MGDTERGQSRGHGPRAGGAACCGGAHGDRRTSSVARRSGLRHEGRSGDRASIAFRLPGAGLFLLFGTLPRTLRSRAGEIPVAARTARRQLPPAPSTPVRCIPRCGRSVRAVARSAAWRWSPNRSRSTTRPTPNLMDMTPAVLDRAGADASRVRDRDGRPSRPGCTPRAWSNWISLGAGDAGGAVGGRAVLRSRLALADGPKPQHVHADRDGDRRRLALQRGGHAGAAAFSGGAFAICTARSRCISKPPPSSPSWCCSDRCWNCGPARAPRARSGRCSALSRRPRGASRANGR